MRFLPFLTFTPTGFFGFTVMGILFVAALYWLVAAAVIVIVALPGPFKVTLPMVLTVATLGLLDL